MKINELELGWLAPDGTFIKCGYHEHLNKAREIVITYKYIPENGNVEDCLIKYGWVYISQSDFTNDLRIGWSHSKFLTELQKNFLKPYFEYPEFVQKYSYKRWLEENK